MSQESKWPCGEGQATKTIKSYLGGSKLSEQFILLIYPQAKFTRELSVMPLLQQLCDW